MPLFTSGGLGLGLCLMNLVLFTSLPEVINVIGYTYIVFYMFMFCILEIGVDDFCNCCSYTIPRNSQAYTIQLLKCVNYIICCNSLPIPRQLFLFRSVAIAVRV